MLILTGACCHGCLQWWCDPGGVGNAKLHPASSPPPRWVAVWCPPVELPSSSACLCPAISSSQRPFFQESSRQTKAKGKNKKFMNFAHFCEFWCFSLGKQARFTLNFCSGMLLRKVHELTFLWFGLPGPLLSFFGLRGEDFSEDHDHLSGAQKAW